ncbi:MAG: hypothetical protein K8M05_07100, partial [Deltaproteobacteria bacterium]|nr:hypothetical protein [Kofleriaceae bacterium]
YAPPPAAPPPAYRAEAAEPTGDLEVIADFALLGVLGSVTLIDARDLGDEGMGTMIVMAGAASGAGVGYLLAEQLHPTRGDGHATTMGMALGMSNAALLLVPLGLTDSSEEVLPTLLAGGTAGAVGGLALSRGMELTAGQSMFATNLALLGVGTSAIASALLDTDGRFDSGETTALLVGLDGGAAAGVLLAPKVDWSYRRARMVGIASMVGFMSGSLIATATSDDGSGDPDPDVIAGGLLAGMWGGFLLGAKLTSGWEPDPKYAPRRNPVAIAPLASASHLGVSFGGTF